MAYTVLCLIVLEYNKKIRKVILVIGRFHVKSQISSFSWNTWRSPFCLHYHKATVSQSSVAGGFSSFPQLHCSFCSFFFPQCALTAHVQYLASSLLAFEFVILWWRPPSTNCPHAFCKILPTWMHHIEVHFFPRQPIIVLDTT